MITVAHHIPGRIRLKFSKDILSHPVLHAFASLAGDKDVHATLKQNGFVRATPNLMARSLTIEYNAAHIAPQTLDSFFSGTDIGEAMRLADQVAKLLNIELQS